MYRYPFAALLLGLSFGAALFPLILHEGYTYGSDHTSHLVYTMRIAEMLREGDYSFWLPDFNMGHPLFFYYQPIAHLFTATMYLCLPFAEPLVIYKSLIVLLFVLFPISIYWGLRQMDFSPLQALCCAALAMSIQSSETGYELGACFQWGLYTQLWGLVMLLPIVGTIYRRYMLGQSWYLSAILLGLLFLTHSLSGISACVAVALLPLLPANNTQTHRGNRWMYIVLIFAGMALLISAIVVPTTLYSGYVSGFFKLSDEYRFGLGMSKALYYLVQGNIYDDKRFPILSLLILSGLLAMSYHLIRWFRKGYEAKNVLFIYLNFVAGFLLVCGTATFTWFKYSPLYDAVPMIRLILHWHLYGIIIAGFALAQGIELAKYGYRHPQIMKKGLGILAGMVSVGLIGYFLSTQWRMLSHNTLTFGSKNDPAYFEALHFLQQLPEGRVHMVRIKSHFRLHLPPILADKPTGIFYAASCEANLGLKHLSNLKDDNLAQCQLMGFKYLFAPVTQDISHMGKLLFRNNKYQIIQCHGKTGYFDVVRSNMVSLSNNRAVRDLIAQWMSNNELLAQKNHIAIADHKTADAFNKTHFYQTINPLQRKKRDAAPEYELFNQQTQERLRVILKPGDQSFANYIRRDTLPIVPLGEVTSEHVSNGRYEAQVRIEPEEVRNDTPAWVLLRVNAHADWVATLDGKPAEWVQMSPCFMAVQVPPGEHRVVFRFQISYLRYALWILSLTTFFILLMLHHRSKWQIDKLVAMDKALP